MSDINSRHEAYCYLDSLDLLTKMFLLEASSSAAIEGSDSFVADNLDRFMKDKKLNDATMIRLAREVKTIVTEEDV